MRSIDGSHQPVYRLKINVSLRPRAWQLPDRGESREARMRRQVEDEYERLRETLMEKEELLRIVTLDIGKLHLMIEMISELRAKVNA